MGRQLPLFDGPLPTADEQLNAAQAEMRLQQMKPMKDEGPRPRYRPKHRRTRVTTCPSCGGRVTVDVT